MFNLFRKILKISIQINQSITKKDYVASERSDGMPKNMYTQKLVLHKQR